MDVEPWNFGTLELWNPGTLEVRGIHGDCKCRAAADLTVDAHGSAMCLDDGLDEAQAEPEAAFRAAAVSAEESIPDARLLIGGNAHAGVADPQDGAIALAARGDLHAPA